MPEHQKDLVKVENHSALQTLQLTMNGGVGEKMGKPVFATSEKRQLQRFAIVLPSEVKLNGGQSSSLDLVSRDVCAGGGFYLTESPLPIGAEVTIKMFLSLVEPDMSDIKGSQITVSGVVVRTEKSGMAVCFSKRYKIDPLREGENKVS